MQLVRVNLIDSVVGNETSVAKNALPNPFKAIGDPFSSLGVAGGGILSSNRIASSTSAKIDRTTTPAGGIMAELYTIAQTGDVTVSATDTANIRSYTSIAASSVVSTNFDSAKALALEMAAKNYSFTTKSGEQSVENGNMIYIDTSITDATAPENVISAGSVYRYLGINGTKNLSGLTFADLSDTDEWVRINGNVDVVGVLFPALGNLAASSSRAIGAMVVMNDVKAGATALINEMGIRAGDDVTVTAVSKAALVTRLEATVRYISTELDEMEREDFVRLKKVQTKKKQRIEAEELKLKELQDAGMYAPSVYNQPNMLTANKDADDLFS